MSSPSARFSSSRRSIRSMKDRRRSPAMPPTFGMNSPHSLTSFLVLVSGGRLGLLLRCRLFLVFRLPFLIGHAVDDLARLGIGQLHALLFGRLAVPARQAITAETGQIHHVDMLHIGSFPQV